MPRYVAFLRAINLGNRRMSMQQLRSVFEQLKLTKVESFIASGNILFDSSSRSLPALESKIETALETQFGYAVETFVRSQDSVRSILDRKFFCGREIDGATIHIGFLKSALSTDKVKILAGIKSATDAFESDGSEYYWQCIGRSSDSKIWTTEAMKRFAMPVSTMRNLTSLQKLAAKHFN